MKKAEDITISMLDNVVIGISMISPKMEITWLNKTLKKWFPNIDVRKKPLCYQSFYSPLKGEICDYCPSIKAFKTGEIHSSETGVCANGRIYNLIAKPVKDEKGITYVVETVEDITERKQAEEVLHESEEKYRAFFEQAADSIVLIDAETGALVEFNNKACENLGYNRKEFQKLKISDFEIIESVEEVSEHIKKIIKKGADVFETKHRRKDGEIRDILVSSRAISVGGRDFIQSIWKDITEPKKAVEALRESEERLRTIVELEPECIKLVALDGTLLEMNPAGIAIIGAKSKEDICGKSIYNLILPEDMDSYRAVHESVGRGMTAKAEFRIVTLDERKRYMESHSVPWRDSNGDITAVLSITRDITERKQAEETLRESEEKFRMLAEKSPNMIFINKMGRVAYVNKRCEEMMGYTREEFYSEGFNFMDLIAPESKDLVEKKFKRHMKGEEIPPYEYKLLTKDGRELIAIHTTKLIDFEGEKAILGIVTDITERKLMEEEVRCYGERLRILCEIDHAILSAKSTEKIVHVALSHIRELVPVQRASLTLFDFDADKATVFAVNTTGKTKLGAGMRFSLKDYGIAEELLKGKVHVCEDISIISKPTTIDKKLKAEGVRSYINVPLIFQGELMGSLNMGKDTPGAFAPEEVTIVSEVADILAVAIQQVRREEELKKSEEKYRDLYDNAPDMYYSIDKNGIITDCNKIWLRMLGYKKEEIIGRPLTNFYTGESKRLFKKIFPGLIKEKNLLNVEREFVRKDGATFPVILNVFVELDKSGELIGTRAIARDITERKQAEETIRKRAEQVIKYQMALLKLAKMDNSNLDTALKGITEVDSKTLGVERVSVWLFKDHSEIICEDLYKLSRNLHERGLKLYAKDYPRYFQALKENRTIAADDARTDIRTNEFTEGYLKPFGITSMMDVPVWLHGEVVGIVCHEHTGQRREWTLEEQEFVASIADIVSLALEASKHKQAEEALRESEIFLSSILEGIQDGVVVLNRDFRILFANSGYIERIESSFNEIKGKHCYRVLYSRKEPCYSAGLKCSVKNVFETGLSSREIRNKGDKHMEIAVYPLKDSSGKVVSVVEIRRDVTRNVQLDKEVKNRIRELEKFYEMAVGRELKMIELKEEIGRLKEELEKHR